MLFIIGNLGGKSEEFIVYNQNKQLILVDFEGKQRMTIKLPHKIKNSFKLKDNVICYICNNDKIHWYNWKTLKFKELFKGNYFYNKGYKEIYEEIDFSLRKELIAVTISDGHHGDRDVVVFKVSLEKKVIDFDFDEYSSAPLVSENGEIVVYGSWNTTAVYDVNKKINYSLNCVYKKLFGLGNFIGLHPLKLKNNTLLFFQFDVNTRIINKIYHLDNINENCMHLSSPIVVKKKVKFSSVKDISKNLKYLLLEEDNQIFLMDLKNDFKKISIKKLKEKPADVQFYEYN
jgi:hypothetical protein